MCARVFSAGCHYRSDVACERSSSPLDVKVHSRPLPHSSPLTPLSLPLPLPALTNVSSQKIMKPAYLHPLPPSTPARFQHPAAYAPAARTVRPNRSSRGRRQASEKKINGDAYSKSTLSATGRLRGVSSSPRRPARSIPPHTVTDSGARGLSRSYRWSAGFETSLRNGSGLGVSLGEEISLSSSSRGS